MTSPNTVYAVRYAHPNSALGGTTHTPKTLSEIPNPAKRGEKYGDRT